MFHTQNGLYFEPQNDGSVRIVKRADAHPESHVVFEQTLDASTWISVIAEMSAINGNPAAHALADRLHRGIGSEV